MLLKTWSQEFTLNLNVTGLGIMFALPFEDCFLCSFLFCLASLILLLLFRLCLAIVYDFDSSFLAPLSSLQLNYQIDLSTWHPLSPRQPPKPLLDFLQAVEQEVTV